ncbi:metallophosphoesterase [Bradyrhizobium prioriisuperbiae]|uniref:metallophosphoesterase family protein n=1 Tax=Bradyrhizobium prioriisuperbiae TaxID=2854389 RepID=UPI0028ECA2F6|nr:metallophosphoesterase [Bradyrhizobium prioritasuperba]
MDQGPLTFRDQFLSVYQSWAADVGRQLAAERAAEQGELESTGAAITLDKPKELVAAEQVAEEVAAEVARDGRSDRTVEILQESGLEDMSIGQNAKVCATLALNLMWAKLKGDIDKVSQIESEFRPGSKCDLKWIQTITEYLGYFGPGGDQRAIPYIRPAAVGPKIISIKAGAKIGLIGDWGTGAEPAKRVLRQLKAQNPDILIHLGDIYYSGTLTECRINFEEVVNSVFDRAATGMPVYTLSGNHDMYCGGLGFYDLIKRLNTPPLTQPASFFCLRADDNSWQLLAMDTGQHDYTPIHVTPMPTYVEQDEVDWHEQRIREFPGKTILLSHHQLFSAFSPVAPAADNGRHPASNPRLMAAFEQLRSTGKPIAAWFWGHEHNLCVYQPHLNLERGRCLGHSAIPVFSQDDPYKVNDKIDNPPQLVTDKKMKLSLRDNVYAHGFATLALGSTSVDVDYFEDVDGAARKHYSERIE